MSDDTKKTPQLCDEKIVVSLIQSGIQADSEAAEIRGEHGSNVKKFVENGGLSVFGLALAKRIVKAGLSSELKAKDMIAQARHYVDIAEKEIASRGHVGDLAEMAAAAAQPAETPAAPAAEAADAAGDAGTVAEAPAEVKRGRGRPPGAKNKGSHLKVVEGGDSVDKIRETLKRERKGEPQTDVVSQLRETTSAGDEHIKRVAEQLKGVKQLPTEDGPPAAPAVDNDDELPPAAPSHELDEDVHTGSYKINS